jgi:hypothetical protein
MAKFPLLAVVLVLAASVTCTACSASASGATTTSAKRTTTTKTTVHTTAKPSTTTSTAPGVEVWDTVVYEQNNPGFSYSGSWTYSSAAEASKGGFTYADSDASVTFHFVGSYCGWLAKTADIYGKATVAIDDQPAVTVDLYSANPIWRHLVWETKDLSLDDHTVTVKWTGKKRTASKGTCVDVDAFQIVGALVGRYQQNNPLFEYTGKWSTTKNASALGGSFTITKAAHASMTVDFKGTQIDWYAKKGPAYGKARVILDDDDPVTIDLFSADEAWGQIVWSSGRLAMGNHVLTIKWTGTKNAEATDTYIDVDALQIAGVVQ